MTKLLDVNRRSLQLLESIESKALELNVSVSQIAQAKVFDFGIGAPGGLNAGLLLSACTCGHLAEISLTQQLIDGREYPAIQFSTDQPLTACMGAQYAGWPVQHGDFFAMASGPLRAKRGQEKVLEEFKLVDDCASGVLCLETSRIPPEEAVKGIAAEAKINADKLAITLAPTSSIAGSIQVVARSVETALHKLHELGFDLSSVLSGNGVAPLPPIANDDLKGIGLTNDAILFGGQVDLWVNVEQSVIDEVGPQTPSSASEDYGTPFYELFKSKDFDFYQIDPLLFSPASVRFHNLSTGITKSFGTLNPSLLSQSFGF